MSGKGMNPDLARASRLFEKGDLKRAEQAAKAAAAAAPAQAAQLLAGIALKRGDLKTAHGHASAAVAAAPGSAPLLLNLATIEFALNRRAEGLATFERAARIAPAGFEAQLSYGKALAEVGRLEEAVAQFRRAHAIAPHPRAKGPMADALFRLERHDEAENWARAALASGLDTAELHCLIGKIHLEKLAAKQAVGSFRAALRKDPEYADALMGLSCAQARLKDVVTARQAARQYLNLRPVARVGAQAPKAQVAVVHPLQGGYFTEPRYGDQLPAGGNFPAALQSERLQFHHYFIPLAGGFPGPAAGLRADVVLNNIVVAEAMPGGAEAEINAALESFGAPVLNGVKAVQSTSRATNAERFARTAGFRFPITIAIDRQGEAAVETADLILQRITLPLILRPPHTQKGGGAYLVRSREELETRIAEYRDGSIYAIEYIDCSDAEGVSRKYRIACVGGELISANMDAGRGWRVHLRDRREFDWMNSIYAEEEKSFLNDPCAALGVDVKAAFADLVARTPLDIFGFDFGVSRDGEFVVFEANAAMAFTTAAETVEYPYMRPHRDRLFERIDEYLLSRAQEARRPKVSVAV